MIERLENLFSEKRLRDLGQFSIEETQADLINVYKYLKGRYKEDSSCLISMVASVKNRSSEPKLKHRRSTWSTRGMFFTVQLMVHCNTLLREVWSLLGDVLHQNRMQR